MTPQDRYFLFLQGPHGPFFAGLAKIIKLSGARVEKIGFNQGDAFYWRDKSTYTGFFKASEEWPDYIAQKLAAGVTDLVLYGDERQIHQVAIAEAEKQGIRVHYFEEGYLRPYWVTYERSGVNGYSPLMDIPIVAMRRALQNLKPEHPKAPARWGELRSHIFHGGIYHFQVLVRNGRYPNFSSHRAKSVGQEFYSHLKKLIRMPYMAVKTVRERFQIFQSGLNYHLVLLQLEHDASIRLHSDYDNLQDFARDVIEAFAKGAPKHHSLVFKAHPLDDFSNGLPRFIRQCAKEHGLKGRVRFVHGGRLARLLDQASSVVTVNSTGAQQALWRGIAVKAMGRAVYSKRDLVSDQSLDAFFANPTPPDRNAYEDYRRYLLATSQIVGGFYTRRSRTRLFRPIVDFMLADKDRYEILATPSAVITPQRDSA